MPFIAYANNEFFESSTQFVVAMEDRGHQFGDGVYEVIRVYNHSPFLLEWHLERLDRSLAALGIKLPENLDIPSILSTALEKSNEVNATIYVQITRGTANRNHLYPVDTAANLTLFVRPLVPAKPVEEPSLLLLPDERWSNVYIKSLNLLPNVVAKQTAHDAGAFDALLVRDGYMLESSSANVWFVKKNELYTAPANRYILAGITRRFVLDLAKQENVVVHEEPLSVDLLSGVDEIFLTGTTCEILPIHQVLRSRHRPLSLSKEISPPSTITRDECELVWKTRSQSVTSRLQKAFRRECSARTDAQISL